MSRPTNRRLADGRDLAALDAADQRAVLAFLLGKHPGRLAIPEVARSLYACPGGFASEDAVERAIRDLVGRRLLCCEGRLVLPAPAALSCLEMK
jgi:hypothetical protein